MQIVDRKAVFYYLGDKWVFAEEKKKTYVRKNNKKGAF